MKRSFKVLLLMTLVVFAFTMLTTGCGKKSETEQVSTGEIKSEETKTESEETKAEESGMEQKKIRIGYVCKMLSHPWFIEEE